MNQNRIITMYEFTDSQEVCSEVESSLDSRSRFQILNSRLPVNSVELLSSHLEEVWKGRLVGSLLLVMALRTRTNKSRSHTDHFSWMTNVPTINAATMVVYKQHKLH